MNTNGNNGLRAIIFDMDGVLIDSEPGYNRAEERLFERMGISFGREVLAAITGANNQVVADLVAKWHPGYADKRDWVAAAYEEALYESLIADVDGLIPGAMEFILRAKGAGLKIAIGSSSSDRMVFHVAESFGLAPLLDTIVTGEMAPRGKPHPDIYLRACSELGLLPSRCIVIEDSINGLAAGRAAGTLCAAFHGTNRHNLDLSDCDVRLNSYAPNVFDDLFAPLIYSPR